jgi:hypothetical protein
MEKLEMTKDEQEILRLRVLSHDKQFESLAILKESLDAMSECCKLTAKRVHELNIECIKAAAQLNSLKVKLDRETEKEQKKIAE